jgi:hypothetical protein
MPLAATKQLQRYTRQKRKMENGEVVQGPSRLAKNAMRDLVIGAPKVESACSTSHHRGDVQFLEPVSLTASEVSHSPYADCSL